MDTSIPGSRGKDTIGAASLSDTSVAPNPPSDVEEIHSGLEHVPEVDLSFLANENLSGNWWKRYDPPNELIWTDVDRRRVREISGGDCLERLEGVLRNLQAEFVEELKSDVAGLAPEVVPPPRPTHHRPKLSVKLILPNAEPPAELEGQSSPRADWFMPTSNRTVVAVPTSPRTDKIKRFWSKRSCENGCSLCPKSRKLALACRHKYCCGCLETMIKSAIQHESRWPPRCCAQDIPPKTIMGTLSSIDMQAFNNKREEYAVSKADRIYCPNTVCAAWIPPSKAEKITCQHCKSCVCRTCRGLAHPTKEDCPGGFEVHHVLDGGHQAPRRCSQCDSVVEGTEGSNQMICECNAKFCYICGLVWKTCACPLGEEHHKQPQDEKGDAERAAKEIEEAEQQKSRLEGGERVIEENWVREVETKYDSLTRQMDSLYHRQWFILGERHRHERDKLESERMLQEEQMAGKLATDVKLLDERRRRKMDKQRILLQRERDMLKSRQITEEDEYWFSLQSHLKGRPNKEERQKTLMEKFTESQAEQMNILHQKQQEKLSELNTQLEIREAGLESAVGKAREAEKQMYTTNVRNMTRHQYGDTKWFEVIKISRASWLAEWKEEEKANGSEKDKFLLESTREPVEMQR